MNSHHGLSGSIGVLSLLIASLLFAPAVAVAKPVLFLLDNSQPMSESCDSSGASYLQVAQRFLNSEVNRGRVVRISKGGLYSFSSTILQRVTLTRDPGSILAGAGLSASGERGQLVSVIDNLFRQSRQAGIDRAKLVIIGRLYKSDLNEQLQHSVTALGQAGWELEFVQVGGATLSHADDFLTRVRRIPCVKQQKIQPKSPDTGMAQLILEEAAGLLGMKKGELKGNTDFVSDLGFDRMFAYEVMSRLCSKHNVVAPLREDLTTVSRITDYITTVPVVPNGELAVRGDKGGVSTKKEPIELRTVFFGTNRAKSASREITELFGGERARQGKVSYGQCEVSIPIQVHKRGVMESPLMGIQMLADPQKHIILKKIDLLDRNAFLNRIKKKLQGGEQSGDVLIFVHGYNVMFEEAARRTAQIAYDLEFKGVPVFFSWPSDGKLYAYVSDREDVEWSVPHIRDFLLDVVKHAGAHRVHLIVHSMGHEGVLRALNLIALQHGINNHSPMFDNIIMAAPDFDAQIFSEQLIENISYLSRQWTLYASDKDMALNVSAKLRFASRLGVPLTVVNKVVTIDATGIEVTPWSVPEFHTYFATKQRVIDDIISVLKGKRPEQRAIQHSQKGKLSYWKLTVPK